MEDTRVLLPSDSEYVGQDDLVLLEQSLTLGLGGHDSTVYRD